MAHSYDLIILGSGFAGCMTTLNFLETCASHGVKGRVTLVEVGKKGERCGASRWAMAYLKLEKDLDFDTDWKHEMARVSNGLADQEYCARSEREAQGTTKYVEDKGMQFVHHEEKNVLLEIKTSQHFVFPEGGGHMIINALIRHIDGYPNCDIHWES